jgi:hypothetical protein
MRRTWLILATLALLAPLHAKEPESSPKVPGKYKDWNHFIDTLEIVQPFKLADYRGLHVAPVDVASTPLPPEGDKRRPLVQKVLDAAQDIVLTGLRDGLKGSGLEVVSAPVADAAALDPAALPTLIFRLRVVELNPGSKAARFWAGFGSGHSDAELAGELVDAKTGAVLLRFQDGRGSSGMGRLNGGDYENLMTGDLHDAAKDAGGMLALFD